MNTKLIKHIRITNQKHPKQDERYNPDRTTKENRVDYTVPMFYYCQSGQFILYIQNTFDGDDNFIFLCAHIFCSAIYHLESFTYPLLWHNSTIQKEKRIITYNQQNT